MKAADWEFKHRAMIFGLIFGIGFFLYSIDPQNAAAKVAEWAAEKYQLPADEVAHGVFAAAALWLIAAALVRTWASAYLHASVVYADKVKAESLVADGPYRYVRNPLYFANVLMVIGMGFMMSRLGFIVSPCLMLFFCRRLILREESDLRAGQREGYDRYCRAVPRLWPALRPRLPSSGQRARWRAGFGAEFWCWSLAAGEVAFAATLSFPLFFAVFGVSAAAFWLSVRRSAKPPA